MNLPSSTSSSDGRRALRVDVLITLGLLTFALGAAELGFRSIVPSLSANSRTLAEAPDRADAIRAFEGTSVLILGNSISGDGIAAEQLQEALGENILVAHQPADTTVMRDWYYELKNQFYIQQSAPDWVVLPVGDAHPLTRVNQRTEDLLYSFLLWSDLPAFFQRSEAAAERERGERGETDPLRRGAIMEDRLALVLSKASALYGFRGRVQKRILVTVAPGYEDLRYAMRTAGVATEGTHDVSSDPLWADLFAELTASNSTGVVVVAMPTEPIESVLPLADAQIAEEHGWRVLAPGEAESWSDEDRPDGLHLSPDASARFTTLLARELAEVLVESTNP